MELKNIMPNKLILIGASTGGPGEIEKIILSLPQIHNTSFIIAQHMVKGFIPSFAKRLQEHSSNSVLMATDGTSLKPGHIYLCNGFTVVKKSRHGLYFDNKPTDDSNFNPDINTIFNSCIPLTSNIKILSIILTGIGDDGVKACKDLSLNGARCVTESEISAIVDGMPSRARKEVPNIEVSDINGIIDKIRGFCN